MKNGISRVELTNDTDFQHFLLSNFSAGVPELCEPASPISGKIPASPLTLHIVEKAGMDVQAPDSTQMNPEDGPCDSTHSAELSAPVDSNAAGDLSANEDSQVLCSL